MYAVIFRATTKTLTPEYSSMATKLREKAKEYGCLDFVSVFENDLEIAISYWPHRASIVAWKKDALHIEAQEKGQQLWYDDYQIDIVEVLHSYKKEGSR